LNIKYRLSFAERSIEVVSILVLATEYLGLFLSDAGGDNAVKHLQSTLQAPSLKVSFPFHILQMVASCKSRFTFSIDNPIRFPPSFTQNTTCPVC